MTQARATDERCEEAGSRNEDPETGPRGDAFTSPELKLSRMQLSMLDRVRFVLGV